MPSRSSASRLAWPAGLAPPPPPSRSRDNAIRKTRKLSALAAKAPATPKVTIRRPASAGPMKRARLKATELIAIPVGRASGGTRLGIRARREGWLNPIATPWTRTSSAKSSTSITPPGASRWKRVSGSVMARIPASSSTVATQIALEPDIGGVCIGSMMMKPMAARGSTAGTNRLTWRKTPPRGSLSRKSRRVTSSAIQRDCAQRVSPGGGATPPTTTSPTSPSAWQPITWIALLERIRLTPACWSGLQAP